MKQLGGVRFEKQADASWLWVLAVSACAIGAAFLVAGVIFWIYGVSPLRAYLVIVTGTLGDARGIAEVFRRAIPLLLVGGGLVLAFRAQFYNIGAEGQLLAGAVAASGVALFVPLPGPWLLPAMIVSGFVAGAAWGLLPTVIKLKLDVNEVITTLMMNYIALNIVDWLIHGPWKGNTMRGFAFSDLFPAAAWLPWIPGTRVSWPMLILGVAMAGGLTFLLARMRMGYEIRVLGQNPEAARYAGINPLRTILVVMVFSGGMAGLAGVGEVAGIHHRLLDPNQISLGYGYAAIIVAWLARGSPVAAIFTATFLGFIFASGDVMKVVLQVPFRVTDVFNGLVLFFLIGSEPLMRYQLRWVPAAQQVPAPGPTPEYPLPDKPKPHRPSSI